MGYKLDKPYTNKQRADFVCEHQGMKPLETDDAIYMLEEYEEIQDSQIVDVSETNEYQTKITEQKNIIKKAELQTQINELDLKRIRALAEGGTMNDGTTYLEYYNSQISALREEINELN